MDTKFRLPRKLKKYLKQGAWLYPPDEEGNRTMAFPSRYKDDYEAWKKGIVTSFFKKSEEERERLDKEFKVLDDEIFVSDEKLKTYVDDIFAKQYRLNSYNILLQAKNHPTAKRGYFNFINAYHKHGEDGSFGNICCLSVDLARGLLGPKGKNQIQKKKRKALRRI